MARPNRHFEPGAFYHITQRGNAQQTIFFTDDDRFEFLSLMQEGLRRFDHRIHAYCLMDNHVHILMQAGSEPLSRAMHNLTFRYAQKLNKKNHTTGHLFQGRFYAAHVNTDSYLTEVVKYIHLNPVRAKLVTHPKDYHWSSHNTYTSTNDHNWLTRHFYLNLFSNNPTEAINLYSNYMEIPQPVNALEHSKSDKLIETEAQNTYVNEMVEQYENKKIFRHIPFESIISTVCSYYNISPSLLKEKNERNKLKERGHIRGILGYILKHHTEYSLTKLARFANMNQSTISRACSMTEHTLQDWPAFSSEMMNLVQTLDYLNQRFRH